MATSRQDAANKSVRLFKIVEELGVPCGYERSFKLRRQELLANRFLMGINTADTTLDKLLGVCRQLDMPERFIESFVSNWDDANLAFLGFEDNEPGCIYKIYLEFWDKLKRYLKQSADHSPTLLHLGFKWNADDNRQASCSKYRCFPRLPVARILTRIRRLYDSHEDMTAAEVAEGIIRFAARRVQGTPFIYVEVDDEHSPRKSFDINLYRANVRLQEVEPLIRQAAESFAVSDTKLDRLFRLVGDKPFGHLSGGASNQEEDFLTIYYEM